MSTTGTEPRVLAPPGRRSARLSSVRVTGGYKVLSAIDADGPVPAAGQFYMLAAVDGWGGADGRPHLPRAFSVATATVGGDGVILEFLLHDIGPGTGRLGGMTAGEELWLTGPLGRGFSMPRELNPNAAGAVLVGGGIGIAPLAIWRRALVAAGVPTRALLGFRDRERSGGVELFDCSEVRIATEDGHRGHKGYVTDLLAQLLEGDDPGSATVYSCGPPAMLEAVRVMCRERGVPAELALEAPMACGYGACFGCAVPLAEGGYMRLCLDGPVVRGEAISTALVAGSGGH